MEGATVSTTASEMIKKQDEEWLLQLEKFEEAERWEKLGKQKTPPDLLNQYVEFLGNYSGLLRMPVYQMMDTFQWDHQRLVDFYGVLTKMPRDTMGPLVDLMVSFIPYRIELVCLYLYREFKDYQVEELVMHTERSDAHLLMQVCRHLPDAELEALVELANRLTLRDILILLKRCNEPMAKHCALCRTRRLHALEQRMIHEQVPDGLIKVPGTLPMYSKAQTWSADDEKGFTFNMDTAEIFWFKYPVDLIQICDKCLLDVNQAITNSNRFVEIHQIDAKLRKGALRELRNHESGLAEVIYKLSHERSNRRGREFALRALEYQRAGLAREEAERKRNAAEEERKRLALQKQQERDQLVSAALSVDQKWINIDQETEAKRLEMRQAYTEVKQRFDYEFPVRKAPNDRLHERTWQLAPISSSGKALLPEGAAQIFGTYVPPVVNHDAELAVLKEKVDANHAVYLAKQAEIRRAKRAALDAEIARLCNHVHERMDEIAANEEKVREAKALAEVKRVQQRALDREMRREKRFEEYLQREREHMVFEDARSYTLRDYEWQLLHEQSEREDMYNALMEQTEFDRFWGLDLYEQIQNQEEARLRQVYEDRVKYLNEMMVKMRNTKAGGGTYSFKKIGTLPEDSAFATEQARREAVVRKLKAEEVRSKLRVRVSYNYST